MSAAAGKHFFELLGHYYTSYAIVSCYGYLFARIPKFNQWQKGYGVKSSCDKFTPLPPYQPSAVASGNEVGNSSPQRALSSVTSRSYGI